MRVPEANGVGYLQTADQRRRLVKGGESGSGPWRERLEWRAWLQEWMDFEDRERDLN